MSRILLLFFALTSIACATDSGADPRWTACAEDDVEACMAWGHAMKERPQTRDRSVVAYEFACHLGNSGACLEVSRFFGKIPENKEETRRALNESCEKGELVACVEIAEVGPRRRAMPVFQAACEAGVGQGCSALATAHRDMWRLDSQLAQAVTYDARACELGVSKSCLRAGQAYLYGSGVAQDNQKAESYFERSCNEEVGDGCEVLARIYGEGLGVNSDPVRARSYYTLAATHQPQTAETFRRSRFFINVGSCNLGDGLACFNAGRSLEEGVEVDRNLTTAREFYQQGCTREVKRSCQSAERIRLSVRQGAR